MKRMYVVLAFIIFVMVGTVWAFNQIFIADKEENTPQVREPFDGLKRRMELREEMHRRMRDKILKGIGSDQDLFKDLDQAFEDLMDDSFTMDMPENTSHFNSQWSESSEGRVLTITPQSKEQKLDIDVNESVITIKGKSVKKTDTTSFSSSFTKSFPVPSDVDGTKVKMSENNGSILVVLPFKTEVKKVIRPHKEERKPLAPVDGGIEI